MTPMRKLIMKMEDMALIVCNQCVSDNGKKPENDDYSVSDSLISDASVLVRIQLRSRTFFCTTF